MRARNSAPYCSRPALFVFGQNDWLVPHAFMRHVEAALPSARCVLFDDCGHVPQFEYPERTAEISRAFIDGDALRFIK